MLNCLLVIDYLYPSKDLRNGTERETEFRLRGRKNYLNNNSYCGISLVINIPFFCFFMKVASWFLFRSRKEKFVHCHLHSSLGDFEPSWAHCERPHLCNVNLHLTYTAEEPCCGMNGPARPEWHYGLAKNRCEIARALCFTVWMRVPKTH